MYVTSSKNLKPNRWFLENSNSENHTLDSAKWIFITIQSEFSLTRNNKDDFEIVIYFICYPMTETN